MSKKQPPVYVLDISVQRSALLSALAAAARVSNDRLAVAGTRTMCIIAEAPPCKWWATDLDMWRGGSLDVESIIQPGRGLLPVQQTTALVKLCEEGLVRLSFTGKQVHVAAGKTTAKIPTWEIEEFPPLPTVPAGGAELPPVPFAKIISQVEPISAANETKYFMKGAYFSLSETEILCVSTNGAQMAKASAPLSAFSATAQTIIPKATLIELTAMLEGAKSVRYVTADDKHVFIIDDSVLISRAIMDKFPAWHRVVPDGYETRVVAKRAVMLAAVRRVILASDTESRRILFSIEGGKLTMAAASARGGETNETIVVDQQGPDIDVYINGSYVLHFLDALTAESLAWEIKSKAHPHIFRPEEVAKEVGGVESFYLVAGIVPPEATLQTSTELAGKVL